jgi:hypothetical protein
MNTLHAQVVNRFRAGEPAAAIAHGVGIARNSVYRILRRSDTPAAAAAARRNKFQSRPDGEYVECRSCVRRGYGEDSWHPATREFWREVAGHVNFTQCKACISETAERKRGIVPGRIEA